MDIELELWYGVAKDVHYSGVGLNTIEGLYDGKNHSAECEFIGIWIGNRSTDKDRNPTGRFSGEILIENLRQFLKDLRNFEKTGKGKYEFETNAGDNSDSLEKSAVSICPVCKEKVTKSHSFLALPCFQIDRDYGAVCECVHKKCTDNFADILENYALSEGVVLDKL